eukprot:CAMPEP_0119041466 /NCGR_PEP_ID=MMETSP1177-20130426/12209_1 /TAXON_ID=2985 /ORGANISM="Ochromonas sp, Strain CCMP1899" /LENGTH=261 /DNA_ID=CAMNT_0007007523 /DNA_START=132 /DNA_END=917 /DNA_ORIENTATION=+
MPTAVTTKRSSLFMANTIAVFGGTGATGREVVFQALNSGANVVVLARDPSRMLVPVGSGGDKGDSLLVDARLKVIKGDVTNQNDVDSVFASGDISGVVIALGGKTKDVGPTMLTDGSSCVIEGMKKCTSKRVAIVTSIGAGDSEKQAPFVFKALMFTVMKKIFIDKNNQEALFLNADGIGHDLEYCIIRPGGLGLGAPTGVINVIDGQAGSIMRADVAAFCLGAVTDASFEYVRKTPCISSVGGTGWVKEKKAGFDAATVA